MTAFLLFGVMAVWVAVALVIARIVARLVARGAWRMAVATVLFAVLVPLPLADEIIGRLQFKALCEKDTQQFIDERNAFGRRVRSVPRGADRYAEGTAVKIRIDPWVYQDVETGTVLVSFHTLHAQGGWLIRTLGISEAQRPLLFHSSCGPADQRGFIARYNMTVVN